MILKHYFLKSTCKFAEGSVIYFISVISTPIIIYLSDEMFFFKKCMLKKKWFTSFSEEVEQG